MSATCLPELQALGLLGSRRFGPTFCAPDRGREWAGRMQVTPLELCSFQFDQGTAGKRRKRRARMKKEIAQKRDPRRKGAPGNWKGAVGEVK